MPSDHRTADGQGLAGDRSPRGSVNHLVGTAAASGPLDEHWVMPMPSALVMDTMARIQAATPGVPLMIPGAFTPRMHKPPAVDVAILPKDDARVEAVPLHDRAQEERELEGGGALRYRRPGGHRGVATRLFDLLLRTTT